MEEEVGDHILSLFGEEIKYKFHAGGREDIDVRMLGTGRPFMLEILNPHTPISALKHPLSEIAALINQKSEFIQATNIRFVDVNYFNDLQESANTKIKQYRCVVWSEKRLKSDDLELLEGVQDLKVAQKTPMRVLHRRALLTREKYIHRIKGYFLSEHFLVYI